MTTTKEKETTKETTTLRPGRKDLVRGTVTQVDEPESRSDRWGRRAVLWLAVDGTPQVILVRCWHSMVDVHAKLQKGDRLELRTVWVQRCEPRHWRLCVSVSHPWQVAVVGPAPSAPKTPTYADLLAVLKQLVDEAERYGGPGDGTRTVDAATVEAARALVARTERGAA